MDDDLLTSHLCTALMRIGTRMATVFDQHFEAYGVTQAQFRVLLAVWEQGGDEGITPSALAEHLLLERATVSVLAHRMMGRGLLARSPGENRRTFRLTLTDEGRLLLRQIIPRATALADETLASIRPAHLRDLRAMLDVVEQRLREKGQREERQ